MSGVIVNISKNSRLQVTYQKEKISLFHLISICHPHLQLGDVNVLNSLTETRRMTYREAGEGGLYQITLQHQVLEGTVLVAVDLKKLGSATQLHFLSFM